MTPMMASSSRAAGGEGVDAVVGDEVELGDGGRRRRWDISSTMLCSCLSRGSLVVDMMSWPCRALTMARPPPESSDVL